MAIAAGVIATAAVTVVAVLALAGRDSSGEPGRAEGGRAEASTSSADVEWRDVAGVRLPFSKTHGPRLTDGNHVAGFSRSELGAALAAVQVLIRTSATSGPQFFEPTLATHVVGPNAAAMKRLLNEQYEQLRREAGAEPGDPIRGGNAEVTGYRVTAFKDRPRTAEVEVVLTAPPAAGGEALLVAFTVSLRWANDDWRVVAPPRGDWGAVARPLGSLPAGVLAFEEGR